MIRAKVERLDAVVYSHAHADHLHGIDDIRGYFITQKNRIPIYAEPFTMARIEEGFGYCLKTPPGSSYPPIVAPVIVEDMDKAIVIEGAGGPIELLPLVQQHGDIISLACASVTWPIAVMSPTFPRRRSSSYPGSICSTSTRCSIGRIRATCRWNRRWMDRADCAKTCVLTHMHTPLDYETVMARRRRMSSQATINLLWNLK